MCAAWLSTSKSLGRFSQSGSCSCSYAFQRCMASLKMGRVTQPLPEAKNTCRVPSVCIWETAARLGMCFTDMTAALRCGSTDFRRLVPVELREHRAGVAPATAADAAAAVMAGGGGAPSPLSSSIVSSAALESASQSSPSST